MRRKIFAFLSLLPSIFCLYIFLCELPAAASAAAFTAVALHECGHAAVFLALKKRLPLLTGQGGGLLMSTGFLSYRGELFYAFGGIGVNLLSALLAFPFALSPAADFSLAFFVASLLYAAFNLIPAPPLDGGRILFAFLKIRLDETKATAAARYISLFCIAVFLFSALRFSLFEGSFFYGIFLSARLISAHIETF